jgi:hypothetical protein
MNFDFKKTFFKFKIILFLIFCSIFLIIFFNFNSIFTIPTKYNQKDLKNITKNLSESKKKKISNLEIKINFYTREINFIKKEILILEQKILNLKKKTFTIKNDSAKNINELKIFHLQQQRTIFKQQIDEAELNKNILETKLKKILNYK